MAPSATVFNGSPRENVRVGVVFGLVPMDQGFHVSLDLRSARVWNKGADQTHTSKLDTIDLHRGRKAMAQNRSAREGDEEKACRKHIRPDGTE